MRSPHLQRESLNKWQDISPEHLADVEDLGMMFSKVRSDVLFNSLAELSIARLIGCPSQHETHELVFFHCICLLRCCRPKCGLWCGYRASKRIPYFLLVLIHIFFSQTKRALIHTTLVYSSFSDRCFLFTPESPLLVITHSFVGGFPNHSPPPNTKPSNTHHAL